MQGHVTTRKDEYVIHSQLAQGAYSKVREHNFEMSSKLACGFCIIKQLCLMPQIYSGMHAASGRDVAIKVIQATSRSVQSARAEWEIACAVRGHPNVVEYVDFFLDRHHVYIVQVSAHARRPAVMILLRYVKLICFCAMRSCEKGSAYRPQELFEHGDLLDFVDVYGAVQDERVLKAIAGQIANALDYMHTVHALAHRFVASYKAEGSPVEE
jgi:serine/threonine protein kinase